MINGVMAVGDGPIKTFPLPGIKDSPPYFRDGRLLTLEDTVEFFNLIECTKVTREEKPDLLLFPASGWFGRNRIDQTFCRPATRTILPVVEQLRGGQPTRQI
jgi:hypothetical protein